MPTSSSALARATPSSDCICSRWTGPTFVITPTSGSQIAVSSAIWPKPRIASSSTITSVPGGAASSSSGSPISVLKFARLAATVRWGAISAAIRSFVEVFPTEPVTAITCAARSRRQARASAPSEATGCSAASTAPASVARGRVARPAGRGDHAPGAGAQGVGGEAPAVDALAREREEQVARLDRARVDHDARRPLAGAVDAAQQLRARRAGDPLVGPVPHARPSPAAARHRPQRRARDLDVVERLLAPAGELLPLLVALARDHDDIARLGQPDRLRDRLAAVRLAFHVKRIRRHAAEDLVDDRLRRLRARVVRRDDHAVGQPRRDLPHQRPLGAVAVAAGAEHRDHAPGGELARRRQHLLERPRLVRVVDEHREALPLGDRLHAARHGHDGTQRLRHPLEREPERVAGGHRDERVGGVEAAAQRQLDLGLAGGRAHRERVAAEARAVRRRLPVGRAVERDRHRRVESLGEPPAPLVVDHDDRASDVELLEQPQLGREVALHVGMEVEVVLAQVRERRGREVDAVGAVQLERMRGDLHRARAVARVEHLPEGRLQVDRLGRRAHRRAHAAADHGGHAAEQAARPAGGLEQLAHEMRRRRLAAGAGDADHRQLGRRVAVEARRGARHRGAHVVDSNLRHAQAERPLNDQRGGAARHRIRCEVVAVAGEPGHAEEQRPGHHRAVVVGEARHLHVGPVAEQLAQRHATRNPRAGAGRRARATAPPRAAAGPCRQR